MNTLHVRSSMYSNGFPLIYILIQKLWDCQLCKVEFSKWLFACLIWFFMSQATIFQLCRDRSSWVEPVLSKDHCVLLKDTMQWRWWGLNPQPLDLKKSLPRKKVIWPSIHDHSCWLGRKASNQTKVPLDCFNLSKQCRPWQNVT